MNDKYIYILLAIFNLVIGGAKIYAGISGIKDIIIVGCTIALAILFISIAFKPKEN